LASVFADVVTLCDHDVMKVLAFLSQKGGAGKTTLAVHTAVAAHEAGLRTVLVDLDPQRSATVWSEARQAVEPVVATAGAGDVGRVLAAARGEGIGLAILDTAPHASAEATKVARAADLVAVPCRPTAFDLAAAEAGARIVKAAGARGVFVLSACPFRAPEIAETRAALAAYGLPVAPAEITDRRAFARAIASGQAVTEFENDGRAAAEIRELWAYLGKAMDA
jgi:chromosome partitioning protein